MAHYKRKQALEYARKFWNIPAHDQCIAISHDPWFRKVPDGTQFVHTDDPDEPEFAKLPDGSKISWADLDDCSHYLSCCLGEKGGGLFIRSSFPPDMYGIVSAPKLVEWLIQKSFVSVKLKGVKVGGNAKIDDFLEPGDLIGYYDVKRDRYGHLTMYLGGGKIACHSYSRSDAPGCTWDNDWQLGSKDWSITFLHISW